MQDLLQSTTSNVIVFLSWFVGFQNHDCFFLVSIKQNAKDELLLLFSFNIFLNILYFSLSVKLEVLGRYFANIDFVNINVLPVNKPNIVITIYFPLYI